MAAQARDLDFHAGFHLGDETNQYIDLIVTRQSNEHLCIRQSSLVEGANTEGIASDHLGVYDFLQLQTALRVLLDNDNFISLSNETSGNQRGSLAAAGNQDAHGSSGVGAVSI